MRFNREVDDKPPKPSTYGQYYEQVCEEARGSDRPILTIVASDGGGFRIEIRTDLDNKTIAAGAAVKYDTPITFDFYGEEYTITPDEGKEHLSKDIHVMVVSSPEDVGLDHA